MITGGVLANCAFKQAHMEVSYYRVTGVLANCASNKHMITGGVLAVL